MDSNSNQNKHQDTVDTPKWRVFIVTNGKIVPEYYANDQKFSSDNWTFVNVGTDRMTSQNFNVVNTCDVDGWVRYGKDWAESEVIANIDRLVGHPNDLDYIGFIHWDFNLYSKRFETYRITENITNILSSGRKWISFFPAPFSSISGFYDVMMDERKPNCLFTRDSGLKQPKSCLEFLFKFLSNETDVFPARCNRNMFNPNYPVSLCCSFMAPSQLVYFPIRESICKLRKSGILDGFDTERRHRYPGQVCERLVALFSLFGEDKFDFDLDHRFTGGMEISRADKDCDNYTSKDEIQIKHQEMVDAFIPTVFKDMNKLNYSIQSLAKHLKNLKNIYVSTPIRGDIKDFSINGHNVKFFNDLEVLPNVDLSTCRFRTNWILQQLLKLCQNVTECDTSLIFDSDCILLEDLSPFDEYGRKRLFFREDSKGESAYFRFMFNMSRGDLSEYSVEQYVTTKYISDMQFFSKSIINEMIHRYFRTKDDFINYTLKSAFWRGDRTNSHFISEYELYGTYVTKYHNSEIVIDNLRQISLTKYQNTQKSQLFSETEIENAIQSHSNAGFNVLKLQSSCGNCDVAYERVKK